MDNVQKPVTKSLQRPKGKIEINYDPNTGQCGYGVTGLTHIEVCGLLQYLTHLHLNQNGVGLLPSKEKSSLVLASNLQQ